MKVYVVLDEGCQECGAESIPVGVFATKEGAEAAKQYAEENLGYGRGGQSIVYVYEMEYPTTASA